MKGKGNMPIDKQEDLTAEELSIVENWILTAKLIKPKSNNTASNEKKIISDLRLFYRCYGHLTQARPTPSNIFIKKIKNGELKGLDACNKLVKGMKFNKNKLDINNIDFTTQKLMLRNFQSLHSSWFPNYNFANNNQTWGTFEFFDPNDVALYITRSLFNDQVPFKEIFSGEVTYSAIRKSEFKSDYLVYRSKLELYQPMESFLLSLGQDATKPMPWLPRPKYLERGSLVGVTATAMNQNKINIGFISDAVRKPIKLNTDFNKGFGGGLLGSPGYLVLNFGNNLGTIMEDGQHNMRTWSKGIFRDLFCRDLPVIKISDSKNYMDEDDDEDRDLAFEKSEQCMQCHVSIDSMAISAKNVTVLLNNLIAAELDLEDMDKVHLQTMFPVSTKNLINFKHPNLPYANGNEKAYLIYRNFYDKLIEKEFSNIEGLGKAMTDQIDPYICISKRYFEYFTGIKINLNQLLKRKKIHDAGETKVYQLLEKLGLELKKHQNLKLLILSIFNTEWYHLQDFGYNQYRK